MKARVRPVEKAKRMKKEQVRWPLKRGKARTWSQCCDQHGKVPDRKKEAGFGRAVLVERQRSQRSHVSCQKLSEDLGSSEVIRNFQPILKSCFSLLVIDVREVECIVQFAVMQSNMVVGALEPRGKLEQGSAPPLESHLVNRQQVLAPWVGLTRGSGCSWCVLPTPLSQGMDTLQVPTPCPWPQKAIASEEEGEQRGGGFKEDLEKLQLLQGQYHAEEKRDFCL
ncbi:uncharacterized protein LOC134175635 [Pezoporus occidentalis]|uniref:uncharacterized protein LOC134175635 n=1 Tax=Pezoporus occidentalis TaxID=407982 RepID=UPI002F9125CD